MIVEDDILGPPYQARTLHLGQDHDGELVATLVRRRGPATRKAVLYVHGYSDYFFQRHMAEFYVGQGLDFYALDLRRYGRSLRPYQLPGFVRSVSDYFTEIDQAVNIIRNEDGHDALLLSGHSTGGLTAALWADRVRGRGLVDAVFLNSPFLDLNVPSPLRGISEASAAVLATRRGQAALPGGGELYGRSLSHKRDGEWEYDLAWKPLGGFPVRLAWLAAMRRAQRRVHVGLAIDVPVLVMSATRSVRTRRFVPELLYGDSVLNVEHMARWAPALASHLTHIRIEDGMHDLTLSSAPVRERVFDELARWLEAYLP